MRYFTLSLFLFLACGAFAQNSRISGKVSASGAGVVAATVSLLNGADSVWVKSVLTDDSGKFSFDHLIKGNYRLAVTAIGCKTGYAGVAVTDADQVADVTLEKENTLAEVTVAVRKPFVEMTLGKTVVNVEGSANTAGQTALDLLRRLPGVMADQNGNISMMGKDDVMVLIDERPTYLSGEELAGYLKSIAADEVSKIEVMTQPGARYEASGRTGVVNIVLKKNKKQGFNGTFSANWNQGVYFNTHPGLMVSYRKNKWNLTLTGNDIHAKGFADIQQHEYYTDRVTGAGISQTSSHSTPTEVFSISTLRLVVDYECSKNTTIGASVGGTYHPNDSWGNLVAGNSAGGVTTYTDVNKDWGSLKRDVSVNGNLKHKTAHDGSLSVNLDYFGFRNGTMQDLRTDSYDEQMHPLTGTQITHADMRIFISIYSARADYECTFSNKLKLEAGWKSTLVTTDNSSVYTNRVNNSWVNDPNSTNRFVYRENINAAYLSLSRSLGEKWEARGGLRAEQTGAHGVQLVNDSTVDKHYISLFPTAFLSYKRNSSNQFELSYGRRIERPGYRQLDPFVNYNFFYHYWVGNPQLKPWFTNQAELKYSYKNVLIAGISCSQTRNILCDKMMTDNNGNSYSTPLNLSTERNVTLSAVFNKDIVKWWSLNVSAYGWYQDYQAVMNGAKQTASGWGFAFNWNTQIDMGKGWKAEANGYYNNGSVSSLLTAMGPQLYMSFGASKKINDRFLVAASTADPFDVCRLYLYYKDPGYHSDTKFRNAVQIFSLAVTYSFGHGTAAKVRENQLEEANRAR